MPILPNFFTDVRKTIAQWVAPGSLTPDYTGHELSPIAVEFPWHDGYVDQRLDAKKMLSVVEMGQVERLLWQVIMMVMNGRDLQLNPPEAEDAAALAQQASETKQDMLVIDAKLDTLACMQRAWIDYIAFGSGLVELGLPIDPTGKVVDWAQLNLSKLQGGDIEEQDKADKLLNESNPKTTGWGQVETREGVNWLAPEWMLPLDAFSFATWPPVCYNPWKYIPGRILQGIVWDIDAKEMMYWQVQRYGVQMPTRIPGGRILQIKDKKSRYPDGKSYLAGIAPTAAQLEATRKSMLQYVMTRGAQRMIVKVHELRDPAGNLLPNPFGKKGVPRFKSAFDAATNFIKNYNNNSAGSLWDDHEVIWAPSTNMADATKVDEYLKKEIVAQLMPRDFIEQNGQAISKSAGPLLDLVMMVVHAWRDVISEPFEQLYNQILEANGFTGWKCKFIYEDPDISDKGAEAERSLKACIAGLITLDRFYDETSRDPIQGDEGDPMGERERLKEWFKEVQSKGQSILPSPEPNMNPEVPMQTSELRVDADIKKKGKVDPKQILAKIKQWPKEASDVLDKEGYYDLDEGTDGEKAYKEVGGKGLISKLRDAAEKINTPLWQMVASSLVSGALQSGYNDAKNSIKNEVSEEVLKKLSPDEIANKYLEEHGGEFIKTLTDTDVDRVIGLIQDNPSMHEDAFKDRYEESFSSDVRLDVIDRTERHRAKMYAYNETADDAGATWKRRLTAEDDRVRDSHNEDMNAGWIPFDEPYPDTEEMFPGEKEINCRCVQQMAFSEEMPEE